MERRKADQGATCEECRKSIRKGSWVIVKGGFYLHVGCVKEDVPETEKSLASEEYDSTLPEESAPGQDCPSCGHWVYGDACTQDGCEWRAEPLAAGEEPISHAPEGAVADPFFENLVSAGLVVPGDPAETHRRMLAGKPCPNGPTCTYCPKAERPRMTMREILDGVRTRGDLAHLSPVDAYETAHGVRPIAVSERAGTVVSMDEKKPDPFDTPADVKPPEPETNVSGQPEPARDQWGRYLLPHPVTGVYSDGRDKAGRRNGWTRATTFAKAAADTFALTRYDERLTLVGATLRPDVVALAHGKQVREDAKELNQLVLQVKEAAGAKVAANIGTAVHGFTERVDAGQMGLEAVPEAYRNHVGQYLTELANAGLTPVPGLIERTTFVDQWNGIAGTFDRVLYHRPSNTYVIGDLKTGRDLKYGQMEIAVQLALYAYGINHHGVYDWNAGEWAPPGNYGDSIEGGPWSVPKVRTDYGVVMHLPIQGDDAGTCTLKRINLAAGWDAAQVCGSVLSSRKRSDYMEDGFSLPAAPYVPETPPEPVADDWEGQFSSVTSKEEASALWRDARSAGVDRMELQRLVGLAQQRLRESGVSG